MDLLKMCNLIFQSCSQSFGNILFLVPVTVKIRNLIVIFFSFCCCKVYLVTLLVNLKQSFNSFWLNYWMRKLNTTRVIILQIYRRLETNGQRIKWQASFIWHYLLGPNNEKPDRHSASEKCQQIVKSNPGLKFCGYLQYKLVPRVTEVELSFSFDARPYQQI